MASDKVIVCARLLLAGRHGGRGFGRAGAAHRQHQQEVRHLLRLVAQGEEAVLRPARQLGVQRRVDGELRWPWAASACVGGCFPGACSKLAGVAVVRCALSYSPIQFHFWYSVVFVLHSERPFLIST